MKYCLLLLLIAVNVVGLSQKVKVTSMNRDYFRHPNAAGFNYLHESTPEDTYEWIADINVQFDTIEPLTLRKLYKKMSDKGNKLGANAFRVAGSDIYSLGSVKYIKLGIYYLNREHRNENLARFQGRKVYLFGFLGHHKKIEGYKIAINGEKMIQRELCYKILEPEAGSVLRVKLGSGFKSDEVKLKIEEDMLPRYYRFDVFRGVFSRSVISEHEWSFGEMLIRIFDKETIAV